VRPALSARGGDATTGCGEVSGRHSREGGRLYRTNRKRGTKPSSGKFDLVVCSPEELDRPKPSPLVSETRKLNLDE